MKKYIFLPALFLLPVFFYAQNLVIFDSDGDNVNNQTITHYGNITDSLVNLHFGVKNNFSAPLDIKMKRTEIGKVPGTQNYFCWSICYNPVNSGAKPTWTDLGTVLMEPDSVYENFSAYFLRNGITGVAGFHYVLYDVNNPADSAYVNIIFDISVSTNEIAALKEISLYPNPVTDKLFIRSGSSELPEKYVVEIYDVIGKKIETNAFRGKKGEAMLIHTSSYNSGIYFCVLKENGKSVSAKKFVISP